MLKSKKFIIPLLIFTLLAIFVIEKRRVIFQEENPIPLAIGMSKMIFQGKEIVEIEQNEDRYSDVSLYLVKRRKMEPFIKMLEKDGWTFVEQLEYQNALIFEKGNQTQSISYRYYTRYYTILDSY
ncbi:MULTISPECIES: hypothetical protein [Bacillus]|uniref:hypothetical protein n=1 Tax=Bacillus TaxID=1386 RepID=UPI000534328E|nr:hypothetical protein [Bacillus pseudomycoides]MED1597865.1 hypothetical protein [Bacillus pseudomycoides]MED4714418.1 hypothetical protein [Bacillus pseudomycoides]OOR48537.1 hypothetical protein BLX05_28975 [Bacillus pseudomycoides]PDY11866.1 hypothetical protein COO16_13335 [Bacillus pseudomycoides]PEU37437.1 hypothetical protein CN535_22685 [Bacillus pseudomycoides]